MADRTNRLAGESSLYLRQHARNPVDWFPWGPEALARAVAEEKPIFLSIGYSACHWCHVMEHESFEDAATAAAMNAGFVCVKVDREERPDLDQIYMTAHQLLSREGGGWPLSVFLTPTLTPFHAGTYFPPTDKYGRPSFRRVLAAIADAWANKREQLSEIGQQVAAALQERHEATSEGELTAEILHKAAANLRRAFDPHHGGFGSAPKFPHALELSLLLRVADRFDDDSARQMVRLTLEKMARGGLYDQVGGGFHRYSVDAVWLVPHFEKMLYDNALLPPVYVEAFQQTGESFDQHIARETLDYVIREMTTAAGGFFSTQDADTEGEEGKFYVWSEAGIEDVLGDELAPFAEAVWNVRAGGNFEGHNILCRARSDEDDAKRQGLSVEAFRDKLARVKCKLYGERTKRVWPGRDEKILTAWNGLMIAAFAKAGMAFAEPRYVAAAVAAADFVLANLRGPDGRLFRTCGVGQAAKLTGYLDDYACLAEALVTLYEATFEPRYVWIASELADVMLAQFADPAGGFFYTAADHERLIARTRDIQDGSTPSGSAMAVTALLKLAIHCDRPDYRAKAVETLTACRGLMAEHPAAAGQLLIALDFHLGPVREVAILGPAEDPETLRILCAVRQSFHPRQVVAYHDPARGPAPAALALLRDKTMLDGRATVYVCENYACAAPRIGADAAVEVLASGR